MPPNKEMSSYYKRMLLMLKEVESESGSSPILKRHIRAIETEMDPEDVAYVEKKLSEA